MSDNRVQKSSLTIRDEQLTMNEMMVTRTVWSIRRVQSDFQHILVVRAETFRLAVALIYPRKSARIFRYCYSYISYHETQNLTR